MNDIIIIEIEKQRNLKKGKGDEMKYLNIDTNQLYDSDYLMNIKTLQNTKVRFSLDMRKCPYNDMLSFSDRMLLGFCFSLMNNHVLFNFKKLSEYLVIDYQITMNFKTRLNKINDNKLKKGYELLIDYVKECNTIYHKINVDEFQKECLKKERVIGD